MGRRVVVLASGPTEREALPHLVHAVVGEDVTLLDVRHPPRHRPMRKKGAQALMASAYWDLRGHGTPPDKFVVLVDVDRGDPRAVLAGLHELRDASRRLGVDVCLAYAQQHLEAWFFADPKGLRRCLGGRDLGSVDTSNPDGIENPKRHLQNLLGEREYTARVAGEIAKELDGATVSQRSPSFAGFLAAMRNGSGQLGGG